MAGKDHAPDLATRGSADPVPAVPSSARLEGTKAVLSPRGQPALGTTDLSDRRMAHQ
jgi:hypothetical protein